MQVSTIQSFIERQPALQQDRVLAPTPDPGTRRWVTSAELRKWGLTPLNSVATAGICLERGLHPLSSEEVTKEVQAALNQSPGGVKNVEVISIQPLLIPEGHLRLPPAGFRLLSAGNGFCSFLWCGAFEFDSHRSLNLQILGRYQAETSRFVAKRSLQAGDILSQGDYETITEPGCSRGVVSLTLPEGSIMRRALNQGDGIEATMLRAPAVVEEGASIRVTASAGGASVSMEAMAEKQGRRGESVLVRNKESGKRIRVLLTGKGEASAIVPGAMK